MHFMYTFYLREKANVPEGTFLRDNIFWYLFIIFIDFQSSVSLKNECK